MVQTLEHLSSLCSRHVSSIYLILCMLRSENNFFSYYDHQRALLNLMITHCWCIAGIVKTEQLKQDQLCCVWQSSVGYSILPSPRLLYSSMYKTIKQIMQFYNVLYSQWQVFVDKTVKIKYNQSIYLPTPNHAQLQFSFVNGYLICSFPDPQRMYVFSAQFYPRKPKPLKLILRPLLHTKSTMSSDFQLHLTITLYYLQLLKICVSKTSCVCT